MAFFLTRPCVQVSVAPVGPELAAASYCSSSPCAAAASATVGK